MSLKLRPGSCSAWLGQVFVRCLRGQSAEPNKVSKTFLAPGAQRLESDGITLGIVYIRIISIITITIRTTMFNVVAIVVFAYTCVGASHHECCYFRLA